MKKKNTLFDYINIAMMILMTIILAYPMWYSIIGSVTNGQEYLRGGVYLLPRQLTLQNYRALFYDNTILNAFKVTVLKSVIGTVTSLLFTSIVAYGMTRPALKLKNVYIAILMFTMYFGGGMIPYFLLIKNIGLYNSFWVYIVPGLFSVWNMIIIQSFMRDLPFELYESAKLDGASEYRILLSIYLPLSKPVLAAIALFTFVGHWNAYFDSMMFTHSVDLQTIQYYLKKILTDPSATKALGTASAAALPDSANKITSETIKLAAMTLTALPVMMIYPFLSKHFTKGMTIGAVKS